MSEVGKCQNYENAYDGNSNIENAVEKNGLSALRCEVIDPRDKYQRSIRATSPEDVDFFMNHFGLTTPREFYEEVKKIQESAGLKADGVLGPNTLMYLYDKHYTNEKPESYYVSLETTSYKASSPVEVEFFKQHFGLHTSKELYEKIKEIQKEGRVTVDGVIGPDTLRYLYTHHFNALRNLPHEMQQRQAFAKFLSSYPPRNVGGRKISPVEIPNPYSSKYFYGDGLEKNIPGTYINKQLVNEIPETRKMDGVYVEKNPKGKYYLELYIGGKREILTYVSPGTDRNKTTENTAFPILEFSEKHISSSYPGGTSGAAMPKGVRLTWGGIFLHSRMVTGNKASHGCIGVPAYYQQHLYSILKKNSHLQTYVGKLY